ncbi:MAG TPA: helix-turn-helix transcriptional regulator [Gemmatimonadales bacterium]|nr:helix-turn-helix transcriptional regulator [Gemmatimonadales bacterium]
MSESAERGRRMELADFLRSRRQRLAPDQLGLPKRPRRRTPGLRREEVAELVGIGVTWYTWLEQGRPIPVSANVLENLARVFRLGRDERAHLFRLARRDIPAAPSESHEAVRPVLQDMLTTLNLAPAHIRDLRWNVLAWNYAESFMVNWQEYPAGERNIIWHHFTNPVFRRLMVNWDREARSVLSEFRMETGAHIEDAWFTNLIRELHQTSAEFRQWWPLHEVRRERELPIQFNHPDAGRLVFRAITVKFTTEEDLRMRVLVPSSETDTAVKLRPFLQPAESHA